MEYVVIILAAILTRWGLRPHKKLRLIAWANLFMFAAFAIIFTRMTGSAETGVDALKFYKFGPIRGGPQLDSFTQAKFMYFISAQIQLVFPVSYAAFNMFAALFMSYLGILIILWKIGEPSRWMVMLLWGMTILPGFHFWHASFSKEAVQLLFVVLYLTHRQLWIRGGSLFVLSLVRPHIALSLVVAEMIARLFERKLTFERFATITLGGVIGFSAFAYLVIKLSGDGGGVSLEAAWAAFTDYGDNWRTGEIRLNDTSSPIAIMEFLLRPYPWESGSLMVFFSFFDSVLLTVFGAYILFQTASREMLKTTWLFAVVVMVLLAFTNPNAGTAHRKKQILPLAVILIPAGARIRRRERDKAKAPVQVPA